MGEQVRYFTPEQLEDVTGMRKEMESLQLRANNSLTLLKDMFKGQTVHKDKAQQNRRMKENSRRAKKNKEARFKVAYQTLLCRFEGLGREAVQAEQPGFVIGGTGAETICQQTKWRTWLFSIWLSFDIVRFA